MHSLLPTQRPTIWCAYHAIHRPRHSFSVTNWIQFVYCMYCSQLLGRVWIISFYISISSQRLLCRHLFFQATILIQNPPSSLSSVKLSKYSCSRLRQSHWTGTASAIYVQTHSVWCILSSIMIFLATVDITFGFVALQVAKVYSRTLCTHSGAVQDYFVTCLQARGS